MAASPRRVRLSRRKGARKPAGAVVVARPSRWGNPYRISEHGRERAAELYRDRLLADPELLAAARRELRGHDLACWCAPDQVCHADVLLELVNG